MSHLILIGFTKLLVLLFVFDFTSDKMSFLKFSISADHMIVLWYFISSIHDQNSKETHGKWQERFKTIEIWFNKQPQSFFSNISVKAYMNVQYLPWWKIFFCMFSFLSYIFMWNYLFEKRSNKKCFKIPLYTYIHDGQASALYSGSNNTLESLILSWITTHVRRRRPDGQDKDCDSKQHFSPQYKSTNC